MEALSYGENHGTIEFKNIINLWSLSSLSMPAPAMYKIILNNMYTPRQKRRYFSGQIIFELRSLSVGYLHTKFHKTDILRSKVLKRLSKTNGTVINIRYLRCNISQIVIANE